MSIKIKRNMVSNFLPHTPLALVLAGLLSASPLVLAESGAKLADKDQRASQVLHAPTFNEVDVDASGELHAEELGSYFQQQLDKNGWTDEQVVSRYDANNSGGLNPPEYEQLLGSLLDQYIAQMKSSAQQRQMQSETQVRAGAENHTSADPYLAERTTKRKAKAQADSTVSISEATQVAPEQLGGLEVVNRNGDEIGEIDKVLTKNGRVTEVVVSVGGILGVGDKEVLIGAESLQLVGNKVVWNTPMGKDAIDNLPEYQEGRS
ncbi:PRC-barrel domain-containing protein [Gilvimarinus polysaccharolyticus]|uniref:PRC-barrel domain-containing protein n=1 Tax=Gilvimarinus polysaccharolyticus TaxID=863921 RepID=UPI000673598D|nr:PRC-barrel domain-containing protein [Gilvimarinus polysaccharolyticus]